MFCTTAAARALPRTAAATSSSYRSTAGGSLGLPRAGGCSEPGVATHLLHSVAKPTCDAARSATAPPDSDALRSIPLPAGSRQRGGRGATAGGMSLSAHSEGRDVSARAIKFMKDGKVFEISEDDVPAEVRSRLASCRAS